MSPLVGATPITTAHDALRDHATTHRRTDGCHIARCGSLPGRYPPCLCRQLAALFAGALVYGRFASDNELDACKASGISLLTLVYPGLILAIIVAIANLVLSFHVMPVFAQRAEKSLKADAKQILFRNINRKGYYKLPPDGKYMIYADQADQQTDTLSGVVVAELKDNGIKKIITTERDYVQFWFGNYS